MEQWTSLCQLVILPLCVWIVKRGSKKLVQELHQVVDSRADAVAMKRTSELKGQLDAIKDAFNRQFDLHEEKDVKRYNDLVDLINTIKI